VAGRAKTYRRGFAAGRRDCIEVKILALGAIMRIEHFAQNNWTRTSLQAHNMCLRQR